MMQADSIRTVSHLTAIIDSVPTSLVMVDHQGSIVLVNTQTETLFGYSRDQLLGEPVELLLPYRFRGAHPHLRSSFFSDPQTRPMGAGRDLFGLRRDGTEFPIEIGLNPIRTEEGLFVVSAIVDITERKRLEARFRATVESAPTAMVMIDQAGTMVIVNTETDRLFGYEHDELLGQKVEVLLPDRFRNNHPRLRTQYFATPDTRRMGAGRDLFGLRKDSSEFPVEIGLNPIQTDEGSFVLAAIVDLTERKRAEEQLRKANEALERSNLDLQQFAYIASHDLQTPLRSISGFVQLIRSTYEGRLDEQADDWIARVVDSTTHMQTLIRDLLAYSRVDSQARPFAPVDLREVLVDVVESLEPSINDLQAHVTCGDLPTVSGDRSQLIQLLQNLVGNALKYHGDDLPQVYVTAEQRGSEWILSVRDNGIGIDPKHHKKIFEIFKRLHTQQSRPGTGIGLAVCRRVVHRHGGRIWVTSESGKGSTFSFTIPHAASDS